MTMSRDEIIFLLTEAAELEHLLCCNYLFTAFTLKRTKEDGLNSDEEVELVRSWAMSIILVAREEMEHLSLVNNLLTAIGGAPHFRRPNFPQNKTYYPDILSLDSFSLDVINRFIRFELPQADTPPAKSPPDMGSGIALHPAPYSTIGQLYQTILHAMETFPGGEKGLFIGPPDAQLDGIQMGLDFPRIGQMGGVFDVTLFPVTNMASARRAIDLIVEQGEGGSSGEEGSHYWRFCQIRDQLINNPDFEPSRPVVSNPLLQQVQDNPDGTIIEFQPSRRVLALFNASYELTLLLLIRFYAHTDETEAQLATLRYAVFFPMMTMVIRPLAEVLTEMPAYSDDLPERAGPSFEVYKSVDLLPHREAAWKVLTERMQELATDCRQLANDELHPRLGFIAESIELLSAKFSLDLKNGGN